MDTVFLHSPTLLISFLMFLLVYLFAYFIVFRNWSPKHRTEASSSFMSLVHGTPAVIMAIHALLSTKASQTFASRNSAIQNRVLEFSMGYFIMDLLHYLVFFPSDYLMILHHLATLYVFVTCRYIVCHEAYGLLVLLVLAEVTSGCQNVWSITGYRKSDVPAAARLYSFLSPCYYICYTVVRCVLGPLFAFKMGLFYLSGAANGLIPAWAWISWIFVIDSAILVGMLWISHHWTVWLKESSQVQKKFK